MGYNKSSGTPYRLKALKYSSGNEKLTVLFQVLNNLYFENHTKLAEYIIRKFMYENKYLLKYQEGFLKLLLNQMQYNFAISLIYQHYTNIEKIGKDYFYKQILQYDYPLAYRYFVKQSQQASELPKYIINAVMREESKIRHEVESRAGAVGLMQLMPQTARYLNKFLKLKGELDLKKPEVNIKIGAFYLKRLFKRYKGNLYHILAAYNAGPTNANRWIKKANIEQEKYFLESISYSETRNYVKRVLKSFYIYQILYET
jgi:soluble lytic murein transglycosylase